MHVREIVLSYRPRDESTGAACEQPVSTPKVAAAVVTGLIGNEVAEVFGILCVSTKLTLLAYHEVSRGSLDSTIVHPREVYKAAILCNAAGVILAHNHPSGDPTPSDDDVVLTSRLKQAGDIVGIEVNDHIIVGHDGKYVSFKELGRL
jgi:DNA repair protein RadC